MTTDSNSDLCISCRTPKISTECEICQEPICRNCVLHLKEDTFSFMPDVPEVLKKSRYCALCYDGQVAPELEKYEETLAQAKNVTFLTKSFKGHIPVLKKSKVSVKVPACEDRDELILRLAFLAAREGYNALIESEVSGKKIRNNGYQKSEWSGVGVPATIDETKLILQEQREEMFRRGH